MADLKPKHRRNEKKTTRKKVEGEFKKQEEIQVHFGNAEKIKIALLNNINKNIFAIHNLLKETLEEAKKEK